MRSKDLDPSSRLEITNPQSSSQNPKKDSVIAHDSMVQHRWPLQSRHSLHATDRRSAFRCSINQRSGDDRSYHQSTGPKYHDRPRLKSAMWTMIWRHEFFYISMTPESEQLLVFLQTIVQTRGLSSENKSAMLDVLRKSPQNILRDAWVMLAPWQCERLWAIARSSRSSY
jgi:hypothetical protein